jgi:hypothetical protein
MSVLDVLVKDDLSRYYFWENVVLCGKYQGLCPKCNRRLQGFLCIDVSTGMIIPVDLSL